MTRLSAEERKTQILAHATRLISQYGFKSVSIRDIAQAAQINEALIYRHFPSKADLLKAILVERVRRQPVAIARPPASLQDFSAQLFDFACFFLEFNLRDPAFMRLILYTVMEDYPIPDELNIHLEGTFLNWLFHAIEQGKAEWGFDAAVDPLAAISSFMGGLIFVVMQINVIKQIPPVDPIPFASSFLHTYMASLKG